MLQNAHAVCVLVKDGHCPNCNSNWDAGSIFDTLRRQECFSDLSDVELADKVAESYGDRAGHFSRLIGIEIEGRYDGVSLWQCPDCQHTWNAADVVFSDQSED